MIRQKKTHGELFFNYCSSCQPEPGSATEIKMFEDLQNSFANQFELFFPDNYASKTIVVIPSLTLDGDVLSKISGALYYEERLLCLLMLLRMPRTQVVYLSSTPIDPVIIDYYLHLLPGITGYHAKERLKLLSCYDTSSTPLTQKILERPRLIERIKKSIPTDHVAHIACFNTTPLERTLSVKLGIPIYGCDPELTYLGTKSGCRRLFLKAGVQMPIGVENLYHYEEIVQAIAGIKEMNANTKKVVLKLNDGFSGDGNALLKFPERLQKKQLYDWIHNNLMKELKPVVKDLSAVEYFEKFKTMGGIAEAFIEGNKKESPSVQCRINPLGEIDIISTHDQVLDGQVFNGANFPCRKAYHQQIQNDAKIIAEALKQKGALGRFSIDFISVYEKQSWKNYAIEINLRKGGTTHPFLMLQFLTNGVYNEATGNYETPNHQKRFYFSTDNIQHKNYKGLTPKDLIDIAMFHGLHFDGASQTGVVFHMLGSLSQFGKMGMVCIGTSHQQAHSFYTKTIEILNAETALK